MEEVKAKSKLLPALCAVLLFGLGIGCGWLLFGTNRAQAAPEAGEPQPVSIRVSDGQVEWSQGNGWSSAGTLDALAAEDPYTPAAAWQAYPEPNSEAGGIFSVQRVPVSRPATSTGGGASGGGGGGGGGGAPATPSAPATGDGENIGWSSDVLD